MLHLVTELKWANIDVGVKEFLYRGGLNYTLDTMTAKYRIMITFMKRHTQVKLFIKHYFN